MTEISGPIPVQPIQLSYVSLAGDQIPPATRENVHLLQHAADYEVCVRNLRRSGIWDIVWGAICCLLGGLLFRGNFVNVGLILLGIALIGVGLWICYRPTPIGMIIDGSMLLLVAGWNLAVIAMNFHSSPSGRMPGFGPVLAIAQIGWAIRRFKTYPRFAAAVAMQPSEATLAWFGNLSKATLRAKTASESNAIEFTVKQEQWKARLMPEMGIFVMKIGSFGGRIDALLASQDAVSIFSQPKQVFRKRMRFMLRINQRTMEVTMPPESLAKLERWIGSSPVPITPALT